MHSGRKKILRSFSRVSRGREGGRRVSPTISSICRILSVISISMAEDKFFISLALLLIRSRSFSVSRSKRSSDSSAYNSRLLLASSSPRRERLGRMSH